MKKAIKGSQGGFTLIELIMVVVILGILSAVAIPRFADLGGEAREASLQGLVGALKSSSAIVHAAWLARGSTGTSVTVDGGVTITTTADGYPIAGAAGITAAAQVDTTNDYTATTGTNTITYTIQSNCTVLYNDGTALTPAVPTFTVTDSGC